MTYHFLNWPKRCKDFPGETVYFFYGGDMRAMGIVGFSKSGKTTLVRALADCLEARGLRVAVVKSSAHGLDMDGTDTQRCFKPGRTVLAVSRGGTGEAMIRWGEAKPLPDLLALIDADITLVEGGKRLGCLPRVLCLREAVEADLLDGGLAVATWGSTAVAAVPSFVPDAPGALEALTDCVLARAFLLPGLDCGACGETDCAELARRIVRAERRPADCAVLRGEISLTINGRPVALNPFTSKLLAGGIRGMLAALKGYAPGGDARIHLKS